MLAEVLDCSIDTLLNYSHENKAATGLKLITHYKNMDETVFVH